MDIRRHIMGLFGIAFLVIGVGLLLTHGTSDSFLYMLSGVGIKVGLVLCAIWLAFPQVVVVAKRFPPWLIAAVAGSGLVLAARPRMIVYLGPLIAAIAILQFVGWIFKPLPTPKRQAKATSKKNQ